MGSSRESCAKHDLIGCALCTGRAVPRINAGYVKPVEARILRQAASLARAMGPARAYRRWAPGGTGSYRPRWQPAWVAQRDGRS